ncbi:hypothetical protein F5X96DRAFT_152357 [Biscogniauxia mediterranea]|nr:hypothetical protein F5X96DRAFT_152357 [Biscogniauxia mediterranea]
MGFDYTEAQNAGYVCAALSIFILICRLAVSRCRHETPDLSFYLVIASFVVIVARILTNYYYLRFGTASDVILSGEDLSTVDFDHVRIGSILVLVARVLITAALWLQICILLTFYSRITSGITWATFMEKATWVTAAVTFIAITLVTFLECRPISLHWQIDPDPGQCVYAYAQLLVQGISNIIIDLMLLVIAYPLVQLRKRSCAEYISLYALFALGTFCIVVTIVRVALVFGEDSSQTTRSLLASVQMLVSTFVANAPTIYGSLRVVRRKKSNQRGGLPGSSSTGGNRRPSRPDTESWSKLDEEIALVVDPHHDILRPLPPASIFFDDETAPAPHSHPTSTGSSGATYHPTRPPA